MTVALFLSASRITMSWSDLKLLKAFLWIGEFCGKQNFSCFKNKLYLCTFRWSFNNQKLVKTLKCRHPFSTFFQSFNFSLTFKSLFWGFWTLIAKPKVCWYKKYFTSTICWILFLLFYDTSFINATYREFI